MKLKKTHKNNQRRRTKHLNGEGVEWQRNNQTMFRDNTYKTLDTLYKYPTYINTHTTKHKI